MFGQILLCFVLQVIFTVGFIVLFGLIIAQCNKKFYMNFGKYGRAVCYITGFIGTPVHELSHAAMCLVFGHRIRDIKLFSISPTDGTLGYVNHSYNRRNIYQNIGNFFIGVAPVVVISAILYGLACWLLPDFTADLNTFSYVGSDRAGHSLYNMWRVTANFFAAAASWQWWVFLLLGIFLALHMTLSPADIKGARSGILFLLAILLISDIIIGYISANALEHFTSFMMSAGISFLCFMTLSLIISLIAVAISYIFRFLRK